MDGNQPNPEPFIHLPTKQQTERPARSEEEYKAKYTFDRVETTSTIWLGLTMTCARCHTHKYDRFSSGNTTVSTRCSTTSTSRSWTATSPIRSRLFNCQRSNRPSVR